MRIESVNRLAGSRIFRSCRTPLGGDSPYGVGYWVINRLVGRVEGGDSGPSPAGPYSGETEGLPSLMARGKALGGYV